MNPQQAANALRQQTFTGHPDLGAAVDADTWLTPRYVLDQLGPFHLDPCAADAAPTWVAPNYHTKERNGLKREWFGRVFMNPPFSGTAPWIHRHAEHGLGISLVPASIESRVWREVVWKKAQAILLLHGRMRFCNPDGSSTTGRPLRSVALIAWGQEDRDVIMNCKLAGVLLPRGGWWQQ